MNKQYRVTIQLSVEVDVIYEGDDVNIDHQQALDNSLEYLRDNMKNCMDQGLVVIEKIENKTLN